MYQNTRFKPKGGSRNIDSKSHTLKQSQSVNPKHATTEYKIFNTNPVFAIEEAYNRLVDWVWPIGKQGDTTVLTANRLLGRNDKGFLIEEKAKELIGIHATENFKPMNTLVSLASALRRIYVRIIADVCNQASSSTNPNVYISEADALAIINILNQVDRYKVFDIDRLKDLKNDIWNVLTDKTNTRSLFELYEASKTGEGYDSLIEKVLKGELK